MADFAIKTLRRGALIGVALAALTAGAAQAQAQDADGGRRGNWGERTDGSRTNRPAQQRAERAPQAQVAQDSGWRQRAPQAQRAERRADGASYGRQWNGSGQVQRPVQAADAGQPAIPQRGSSGWQGQRGGSEGWRRSREAQPAQQPGAQSGNWSDRNASYRDPRRDQQATQQSQPWGGRNPSYRDPRRDDQASQSWRNTNDWRRGDAGREWSREWRQDRRYDWNTYRSSNRDLYRMPAYYAPYRDYSYRRLSIGYVLQSLFFGQRYWINDPWQYRLPAVYGPYRWVRYYDDAVLVDVYTGRVVDVINRFFW
jgi:hypothetical protein